jgi:hypothetical protein
VFLKLWSAAVLRVVRGSPQAVSEEKALQKIVSDTERMKNTPIHVCAKTAFLVDLQNRNDRNYFSP